ncbi:MAG: TRAP transporter small permease subunit [Thermodesulfobacteriota bacterium]
MRRPEDKGNGLERFLVKFDSLSHKIDMILFAFAAVLLGGLIFMVGADLSLRYLFNMPLGWVKEISEYIILFIPFLVAAWIMETDGHLKMDFVVNAVGPRARRIMNMVSYSVGALVVLILAIFCLRVTLEFYRTGHFTATLLRLPKFIFIAVIFLGFVMLFIQLVRKIIGFAMNIDRA